MMLNPLLILYLKTQVLTLPEKLQCLLFTLRNTEKKCWLRNSVLVCNCQKQWDIGVMLAVQHSVCMLLFMLVQCEMAKVRRTMYIVHQIIEDSAEAYNIIQICICLILLSLYVA